MPLPTGQVLLSDNYQNIQIYTPIGQPNSAWAPAITNAPATLVTGQTYTVTGTQFNGLSQAAAYGDDVQQATNFPLVRITNNATGDVFYCRTHDHSTMAVATGTTPVSTRFDVGSIETGASTMVVVANGIASGSWAVTIQAPAPALAITSVHTGNFTQGQTGTYTITVANSGLAATSGTVTVTDTLPAGLTAATMAGSGWTCTVSSVNCTRSSVLGRGPPIQPSC